MRMGLKRKIVVLCGSSRFKDAFIRVNKEETLKGNIVLSIGMFGHHEGIDMEGQVKKDLDDLHLDKIDLAHEVIVLNEKTVVCHQCKKPCETESDRMVTQSWSKCCGAHAYSRPYIGDSTRREIEYSQSIGKPIVYLYPPE